MSSCGQRTLWFYAETNHRCYQKIDDTCPGFNRFMTKDECEYRCIIKKQEDRLRGLKYEQETEYFDYGNPDAYPDEIYSDNSGEINYPIDVDQYFYEEYHEEDVKTPIINSDEQFLKTEVLIYEGEPFIY